MGRSNKNFLSDFINEVNYPSICYVKLPKKGGEVYERIFNSFVRKNRDEEGEKKKGTEKILKKARIRNLIAYIIEFLLSASWMFEKREKYLSEKASKLVR